MAMQRTHFASRYVASGPESGMTLPDVRKVAEAYGIATAEIRGHQELRARLREVVAHDGPIVCAVSVSPEQATAPRATSSVRADGSIVSRPMEDLWPLLSREEFLANMIVPVVEE
jgi:acetolactate synthase-1/2/3 large subunit